MSILTPEQIAIQQRARDFVAQHIIPVASEWDRKAEFHQFILPLAKQDGFFAMAIPKAYGGLGYSSLEQGLVLEQWAYGCAAFGTTLAASLLSMDGVLAAGNDEQKTFFFAPMVAGEIGSFCLTEPGAGSDAGGGSTHAVKDGDGYVINGTKVFITNGGYASVYLVLATTDPSKGVKGLSAFVVPRSTPGLTVGDELRKVGIRSSNTVELIFQNMRVPAAHRLGDEGEGMRIALTTLDMARPAIAALGLGLAQRTLDECVRYMHVKYLDNKAFPPQAVQFALAEMEIAIQAARQMLYHTFELRDAGVPYSTESAISKALCGDTAMDVTRSALDILGSHGYSREGQIEKFARDAKIMQIYEGTNQIQRLVIGRALMHESLPSPAQASKEAA
jgi:acyl-CoA dehydrogenase